LTLKQIKARIRTHTNDTTGSIFSEDDIISYINEGIDRIKSKPYFVNMVYLVTDSDVPTYLPSQYHYLIPLYATSRLFSQDERHYQGTSFMNDFEYKLDELVQAVEAGDIILTDPVTGEPINLDEYSEATYVEDIYFSNYTTDEEVW
jgi:hypothetical protein